MFDLVDAKDQLRAIYGFIFSFVTDENLVCVLLYLFTLYVNLFICWHMLEWEVKYTMDRFSFSL